jgi:beta-lactamase regulating signal transducer with metallopeptidase domain
MSLTQILSTYATMNLLVILAFLTLKILRFFSSKWSRYPSAATELRVHYMVLTAIIVIVLVQPWLPQKPIFQPAAKVWSAQSIKTFPDEYTAPDKGGYINLPIGGAVATFDTDRVSLTLLLVSILVLAFGSLCILRDINGLRYIRRRSYLVRRIGRVSIFANDDITVPFSYWLPGHSDVVIPNYLMANHTDYRMAVAHELQHHRQTDTKWVYVMWSLRIICVLNPFIHLWSRELSEIQEFACDETLVDRNKVESRQYICCLIEVAQTSINQKRVPVCATGLTFLVEHNSLKRRIEKMISTTSRIKRSTSWSIGGGLVALMAATAFASQGLVQDRRVTMADAQAMAANARNESDFPVVVNDLVLTQLNRYIGTPEGREFMKRSLQRMDNYRALVEEKINEYQVPMELAAIPIVESGYQNLSPNNTPGVGAGIWMFLAQTARNYGLRVDDGVDERLNAELLTGAAMRYLKGGKLRFDDWLLSVLAYNSGDNKVQKGIDVTGSRDAWVLVRNGYGNDNDYLAKLMAAILIVRNPESVE